jgi:hypothetical protein
VTEAASPLPVPSGYFPVSGEVDGSGRLVDLIGVVDSTQGALITPPPPPPWTNPTALSVTDNYASGELTATLGFGGGQSASGAASAVYKVVDLLQTQDVPSTVSGGPIQAWVFGVGMRMSLSVLNASASVTASYMGIAASATLGGAETSFELQTVGMGFDALPALRGLTLQTLKGFDAGTIEAFGDAWFKLGTYMGTANPTAFRPRLVGVRWGTFDAIGSIGGSYGFALRAVREPLSCNQALAKSSSFPDDYARSDQIVKDLYAAVVPGGPDKVPDGSIVQTAADLDDSGP